VPETLSDFLIIYNLGHASTCTVSKHFRFSTCSLCSDRSVGVQDTGKERDSKSYVVNSPEKSLVGGDNDFVATFENRDLNAIPLLDTAAFSNVHC